MEKKHSFFLLHCPASEVPGPPSQLFAFYISSYLNSAPLCNDHFLPRRLLGPATRDTQEMDSNPRMGNRRWIFHNGLLKQGRGFRINSRLHREAADAITMGPVPRALCPPLQEGSRNTWETTAPSTLILPQGEASQTDSRANLLWVIFPKVTAWVHLSVLKKQVGLLPVANKGCGLPDIWAPFLYCTHCTHR